MFYFFKINLVSIIVLRPFSLEIVGKQKLRFGLLDFENNELEEYPKNDHATCCSVSFDQEEIVFLKPNVQLEVCSVQV